MADASGFLEVLKKAVLEALEATKPVNVKFGEVKSKAPLKISVEQKMILSEAQLILTRNVTEYKTAISVQGVRRDVIVHNALEVEDKVILIRQQEGQKFIVVDRIGGRV